METAILAIVLLGGCLVMHLFMMKGHRHSGEERKDVKGDNNRHVHNKNSHSDHSCCH